ncbi:MAG: hypothetical protein J6N15_11545 [Ruminiclostridium sp.]|nr:hypothetical protein [Ruminiclostridium sp.]
MKNDVDMRQGNIREITVVHSEPKKSSRIFHAAVGIAGAAAVLSAAVFGLRYLAENGGLKEGGSDELRAGYSQNTAAVTTAGEEQPEFTYIFQAYSNTDDSGYVKVDQRYGFGDDLTVHLREYIFDGIFAKISYELVFKDEITGDISDIRQIWPKDTESGHCDSVEYGFGKNTVSCSASYRLETFADQTEVSFGYKDDPKSELFGLTMFKSTDRINEPMITTAIYMTAPDNNDAPVMTEETTVTTDVLVTSEYATTATAEWTDDTTYNIPQVKITDGMLDHTDVTLALGEGNVKILPGKVYDGRILKLKLEGSEEDTRKIGIRSISNPRTIMQSVGEYNSDGTRSFWALICVPEGETDTLELLDLGTVHTEGKPKATEVINISGIADYEPLTQRVGVDMMQFGMPDETLEWLWLSPLGLEMYFTSDKQWSLPEISVEVTSLNNTTVRISRYQTMSEYNESSGKYRTTVLVVPDYDTDLTEMKEFSINGLKTKRAEFMPRSFWDIPEDDSGTMTPVETAVHIAAPEE